MSQQMYFGVQPFVLLCIPLFMFSAEIMCQGKAADRLLDVMQSFIGHVRGGLAIATVAACTFFGSISGSCQATLVAIGRPMRPKMLKAGYSDKDVLALLINSANIALLIPPSSIMIMYCVLTGTSVAELFVAGVGPGLFLLVLFSVYSYFNAKYKHTPTTPKATWPERLATIQRATLALGFPLIILRGLICRKQLLTQLRHARIMVLGKSKNLIAPG